MNALAVDAMSLRNGIDHAETLRLLQELIRIPSPTGDEERIAAFVERYGREIGAHDVLKDDRHNVLITLRGSEPGPTVLLLTHTDSAGAGRMEDPYEPRVSDGADYGKLGRVVRGLGACAPKSAVAAMLSAARTARRLGLPKRGVVHIAAVTKDMQANHQGPRELLGGLDVAMDLVVAGEPTGARIALGARGIGQFEIRISGTPTHWGRPADGVNPLYALADVLVAIERAKLPSDPVVGHATIAPFDVRADAAPPRTPEHVVLTVDRRTLPGEATADIVDGVRGLAQSAVAARAGIAVEVELIRAMHSWRAEAESEAVATVQKAAREVFGEELDFLDSLLARMPYLSGAAFGLADVGYVPWVLRARDQLEIDLTRLPALSEWVGRLAERPSVAAEIGVVAAL